MQLPPLCAIRRSVSSERRLRNPQSPDSPGRFGPEPATRVISSSQFGRGGARTCHDTRKSPGSSPASTAIRPSRAASGMSRGAYEVSSHGFPTAGGPGRAFNALFLNDGLTPDVPVPTGQLVPVVTRPKRIVTAAHPHQPAGPLVPPGRKPSRASIRTQQRTDDAGATAWKRGHMSCVPFSVMASVDGFFPCRFPALDLN